MYLILKHSHIFIVSLAFTLFIARSILMFCQSSAQSHKFFKIIPHIFYTLLIVTGVWLAVLLSMSPSGQPWLVSKIIGLIVFIVLALLTFNLSTLWQRIIAFALTVLVFANIVITAISKDPAGLLILLN